MGKSACERTQHRAHLPFRRALRGCLPLQGEACQQGPHACIAQQASFAEASTRRSTTSRSRRRSGFTAKCSNCGVHAGSRAAGGIGPAPANRNRACGASVSACWSDRHDELEAQAIARRRPAPHSAGDAHRMAVAAHAAVERAVSSFILPRESGEGGPPEGWWKGRRAQRISFDDSETTSQTPPPPHFVRSPSPAIAGAEAKRSRKAQIRRPNIDRRHRFVSRPATRKEL